MPRVATTTGRRATTTATVAEAALVHQALSTETAKLLSQAELTPTARLHVLPAQLRCEKVTQVTEATSTEMMME